MNWLDGTTVTVDAAGVLVGTFVGVAVLVPFVSLVPLRGGGDGDGVEGSGVLEGTGVGCDVGSAVVEGAGDTVVGPSVGPSGIKGG